ncbi:MAG: hypothetical protein A2079_00495 [Geobacteraceae bacterium GWC2_48_7]|nr:MAG: hypothetical protein A2079_00495 [Geobacteraceae bacterium GWC2_48_7]
MNLPDVRTDMEKQEECCSGKNTDKKCRECESGTTLPYWCETCQRLVPEKRCPYCGLKARKVRSP